MMLRKQGITSYWPFKSPSLYTLLCSSKLATCIIAITTISKLEACSMYIQLRILDAEMIQTTEKKMKPIFLVVAPLGVHILMIHL